MADISVINVGGSDYNVKDATGRSNANTALAQLAYQETGNTASQAYATIGTPINWKGTLYYTKTAVAKGATWVVGTNLTAAGNLGKLTSNIKTYVNSSGKLVFRDLTGADTVLPFSGTSLVAKGKYHRWFYGDVATQNKMNQSFTTTIDTTAPPYYSTMLVNVSDKNSVTISAIGSGEIYCSCYLIKSDGTLSSFYPRGTTSINLSGYDYLWASTYNSTTGYTRLTFS